MMIHKGKKPTELNTYQENKVEEFYSGKMEDSAPSCGSKP